MPGAQLEHVNVTVSDPAHTAERLCALFDWKVRWSGPAKSGGRTFHVGSDESYVAVYSLGAPRTAERESYETRGGLNHIGVVVPDLDAAEKRILGLGYKTHSHADYEPGRRFYFHDDDGIEFEVLSYA